MKTKLLFFYFLSFTLIGFCQQPITSYFGENNYIYANIEPATPISHTTSGANVTWTFGGLSLNGTSSETNSAPTATEVSTFPNSNNVHTVSTLTPSPSQIAKIYSYLNPNNVYSFTGFDANGVILNYSTNNATLGLLPLNYGFTNNDPIAGTFINGANTGTFSGTITTDYDSYGTLNLNIDALPTISSQVFRVKVQQNINLFINIFINIGTVQQTTHTYYFNDNGTVRPYFRDTTYVLNVPLLNLFQTTNQGQLISDALLSTKKFDNTSFSLYPNPINEILNINMVDNSTIFDAKILDLNGKEILVSNSKTINVSTLKKGIYFIEIKTKSGKSTQKFIKK